MIISPKELLGYRQWVFWRHSIVGGRVTKVPVSPWNGRFASCDQPATWSSYRHALHAKQRFDGDGLGFVFAKSDPFCGIDVDACRDPDGEVTAEALSIVERLSSYTEISPSGKGIHILVEAKLPGRGRRIRNIEMYDSGRYFTMTGNELSPANTTIYNRHAEVCEMYLDLFSPATNSVRFRREDLSKDSDDQLLEHARAESFGSKFVSLWSGELALYDRDHSRADLALCRLLSFLTGNDAYRINRLFRRSGLMRPKWDRKTGDTTYGQMTIDTVMGKTRP